MKVTHHWHSTPLGRLACSLGSVRLAVPVLVLVAVAMAWGTYLESAYGTKTARANVYGAWWFIALMVLVCISLIFAVVVRYPWRRRHVGFITVHASLIALIAGGFWSLFGRVEGQLPLQQGTVSAELTTEQELVELLRHQSGTFEPVQGGEIDINTRRVSLGDTRIEIVDRWVNTREEAYVSNDSPVPLRAVELSLDGDARAVWVGEETPGAAPAMHRGLRLRILPAGEIYRPATGQARTGFAFIVGEAEFPLPEAGAEAFPGWTVESVRFLQRAMVTGAGLVEGTSDRANPAVEVVITDGQGGREQHRAFLNFPDMLMSKPLEGDGRSGARLIALGPPIGGETLIVHGTPPALDITYIGADGSVETFASDGTFPFAFGCGGREIRILQQFANARPASRIVKAPKGSENRPALLVRIAGAADLEPVPLLWRIPTPVFGPDGAATMLRYGPQIVPIPFAVRLDKFRKLDYPGTEMAMSYESDVTVAIEGHANTTTTISMNKPFAYGEWKVYQSGFMGTDVSIFSVMRDPGLPLTYAACIGLCIGIVITFYSRALSPGHPGIPAPFARKDRHDDSSHPAGTVDGDGSSEFAGSGGDGPVDGQAGVGGDPGQRADHAAGHLRHPPRRPADREVELVG